MDISKVWLPLLLALMAGMFTLFGGLVPFLIKDLKKSYLQFSMGLSAGMMIYISFVEILTNAIKAVGFLTANAAFFGGILFIMFLDFLIPHEFIEEHIEKRGYDKKTMKAGVLVAIGIAIHNFPEGMAVFMSSMVNIHLGITIALAIALHNIPEGIAVAMPVYYATKSKRKACKYAFLTGIAEPIGAVVTLVVLLPFLNPVILSCCLAAVAGIMIFISFDELLPLSYEGSGSHVAIIGIILGMFVMGLSLQLF
jgi:zinc transporter, ZIP family